MSQRANDTRFFNRELSWIEFNARVIEEAADAAVPLLERLKFIAIAGSNFDEFFMVRVAAIKNAVRSGDTTPDASGKSPRELLLDVTSRVRELKTRQYETLVHGIIPDLARKSLKVMRPGEWDKAQRRYLETYFGHDVFPLLTPLRVDDGAPFPTTGNLKIHIAFTLASEADGGESAFAIVQVPPNLSRFVEVPDSPDCKAFALLDDIVGEFGAVLFPGYRVSESLAFKVTRDADFGVDEERDDDFVQAMEEVLVNRQNSWPVRLNVSGESDTIRERLRLALSLDESDVFDMAGPLDARSFMELTGVKGFDSLRDAVWKPVASPDFPEDVPMWDEIRKRDILLHVPYESFDPVVRFVRDAASDPDTLGMKMTLYRTSGNSPIVQALRDAARAGKQVTVFVELKARFDEERNIAWASSLENSGVIVVYGIARYKVHAKAVMVIRRESGGIRRYVHLSTGNYNDRTARLYSDLSLFTANEDIAYDIAIFFNSITGYSSTQKFRRIVMAPFDLKRTVISLIEREASRSTPEYPGLIMAKMNSLADTDVIDALYAAQGKGVRIHLNVRGVCMLVPGSKGLSENIAVVSVVDRYLEHSRIFYFNNGGADELWLSSADWMTRNLERRVEIMFPVRDQEAKRRGLEILKSYFRDTLKSHVLLSWGRWKKRKPAEGDSGYRVQDSFRDQARARIAAVSRDPGDEFTVRKNQGLTRENP